FLDDLVDVLQNHRLDAAALQNGHVQHGVNPSLKGSVELQLSEIAAFVPGENKRCDPLGYGVERDGFRLGQRQRQLFRRDAVDCSSKLASQSDGQGHAAAVAAGPAPEIRPKTMEVGKAVLRNADAPAPYVR